MKIPELNCFNCIHGELCIEQKGGMNLQLEHIDCRHYKSIPDFLNNIDATYWVDVNDTLPKENGKYIVYTKNLTGYKPLENNIFIANFILDSFIFDGWEDNCVTHWRYLPIGPEMTLNDNIIIKTYIDKDLMLKKLKEAAVLKYDWSEMIYLDDFEDVIKKLSTVRLIEKI